jgi:hypothetical protein
MSAAWVQLRGQVPEKDIAARAGARALRSELALELGQSDVDVYRPDGQVLLKLRRGAVPKDICEQAYPGLRKAAIEYGSDMRSRYGGGAYGPKKKLDGTYTKNMYSIDPVTHESIEVSTAVAGYFDRVGGRWPFCRTTAFTLEHVKDWHDVLPMVHHVASVYAREAPDQYKRQRAFTDKCSQDFVIRDTPFTTLTINHNVIGTIHKDAGDFKDGLGIITVVRRGSYAGALLAFPQYKVGVDLRDGDLVFFNPHDWHAVTEFEGSLSEDHERISVVYYARTGVAKCGSAHEELERAKRFREGSVLEPEPKPEAAG